MSFGQENEEQYEDLASRKKAKLGIRFFIIYSLFYAGFVLIGVFNYELLSVQIIEGVNLAVFYGIGLIIFAVFLGVLYNYFCTKYEDKSIKEASAGEGVRS